MFKNVFNPVVSFQSFGTLALDSAERFAALGIAHSRSILESTERNIALFDSLSKSLLSAKTLNDLAAPYMEIVVPALSKSFAENVSFADQVTDLHREIHGEIKSHVKTVQADISKASQEIIDSALKHAPADSKVAALFKNGVNTARGHLDQVTKIADQFEKTAEAATAVVVAQAKKASAAARPRKA